MDKAPDAFRTISEVAEDLDVPQHVLRFWESRFAQIKPMKRGGGRRYYRPEDIDLLRGIRFLLYGEGYTIRGVQRILKEEGVRFVQSVWREGAKQLQLRGAAAENEEADGDGDPSERSRGLLGLLPTFEARDADEIGDEDDASAVAQNGPSPHPAPLRLASDPLPEVRIGPRVSTPEGLTRADLQNLQAALKDLTDCRRMLDAALKPDEL